MAIGPIAATMAVYRFICAFSAGVKEFTKILILRKITKKEIIAKYEKK